MLLEKQHALFLLLLYHIKRCFLKKKNILKLLSYFLHQGVYIYQSIRLTQRRLNKCTLKQKTGMGEKPTSFSKF